MANEFAEKMSFEPDRWDIADHDHCCRSRCCFHHSLAGDSRSQRKMSIGMACFLTVLIETMFLALFGYRRKSAIAIIVCTNVITNLVMNTSVALLCPQWTIGILDIAEALVVGMEYAIYVVPFGNGWRLFLLTLAANALSCGVGLVIMRVS